MNVKTYCRIACGLAFASLAACGGGSGSTASSSQSTTPDPQSGSIAMMVSDASSDDWATIGVTVLSIALTPQGGGSPVIIYTAPTPAPMINLMELDNIFEVLGNPSVPPGTYTGATITVSGNPADFLLIASSDPEPGFAGAPGATIPTSQIKVQGTSSDNGVVSVPINVNFSSPLVVSANATTPLDIEFDLSHPAFIVAHTPPGSAGTLWAINFKGPVRHHPIAAIDSLVLRHMYGTVTGVAMGNSSITITRDLPALPVATPETAVTTSQSLTIEADATNGTLFYDLDNNTSAVIKDFSAQASSITGNYVRIAARYQPDGTLVAVRIWESSSFDKVWLSPEGHVLQVDATAASGQLTVLDEAGRPVALTVNSGTKFYFRTPANAQADATPIGSGPGFLTNLVRGFKVHVSCVDPLAAALVAQSVDIETAAFSGQISAAGPTDFTYTHAYRHAADDYQLSLDYIAGNTANGTDGNGDPIMGFKYWDFTYPTLPVDGSGAIGSFTAAVGGTTGLTFAGASISAYGVSDAVWANAANPSGWSLPFAVLEPTPVPLATVTSRVSDNSFTMTASGATTPGTVAVSTTAGSATLVYQVDRTGEVLTVSPIDISTNSGLGTFTSQLAVGVPVKVYGVPQDDGSLKAYVVTYFTGSLMPAQ